VVKQVGGVNIQPRHRATCHCGMVELELNLPLSGLHILRGAEHLKLYQCNSGVAKHYFCSNCGIYTHHQTRSNPNVYGFNIGCLEGVNPYDLDGVAVSDGINHESDL